MEEEIITTTTNNEPKEINIDPPKGDIVLDGTILEVEPVKEEDKESSVEETPETNTGEKPVESQEETSTEEISVKQEDESMELRIKRVLKENDNELTETDISTLLGLMEQLNKGNKSFLFNKLPNVIQKRLLKDIKNKSTGGNLVLLKEKIAENYLTHLASMVMKIVWDEAFKKQQAEEKANEDKLPPIEDEKLLEEWKAKRDLRKSIKELDDLLKNTYKEAFEKVDEIEKEDPERAERIRQVQSGFKYAENFQELINYIDSDKPKNIKRYHQHYNSDTETMHKYLASNSFHIAAPSTAMMYEFLKSKLDSKYTTDDIKGFITLLSRTIMQQDVNDLEEFAYVFKLLSNIYCINMTPNQRDIVIDQIAKVIDHMNSKKGGK